MKEGGGGHQKENLSISLAKHNEDNDHPCGNGGSKVFPESAIGNF